ncbi:hypothetical protein ASE06_15580 [Sphingopyxis sp. Root214]|nr:hypothetical protein ASD73_13235 [Sphingopyxis sp. Root154]KRC07898.1 hypothetical protein ASE06_15580 [Sphingopyxis sp. Root214]
MVSSKPTKYKSNRILERRDRILRVARKMLAESGAEELSVRELCKRAGIAQKTLYNAFGSKDHVITLAVQQYTSKFTSSVVYKFPQDTLDGQIERLIKIHSRNTQLRAYTTAIMSVYNSPHSDRELRNTVREMSIRSYGPFIEFLAAEKALRPGVEVDHILASLTTSTYSNLTDWCIGDIADDKLVERVCEGFLMIISSSTDGDPQKMAVRWLSDLREAEPSWRMFRRMAEVEPGELQAALRESHSSDGAAAPATDSLASTVE